MENTQNKTDIVIPLHLKDADIAISNIPIIIRNIHHRRMVIVCSDEAKAMIQERCLSDLEYYREDSIANGLTIESVKSIILARSGNAERAGWYFQQFLKMAYSLSCEDEWYVLWDADTIPLSEISLFEASGRPVFDLKNEYHRPYFYTLMRLMGLDKEEPLSFIAEHMVISTKVMRELIKDIEANDSLAGVYFWEKILYAIPWTFLRTSGFSEFETYGNYVMRHYPGMYATRRLRTLRPARIVIGDSTDEGILRWAAKSYDTISYEKSKMIDEWYAWISNSPLRRFVSLESLWKRYRATHYEDYIE
ncbi:MAG: hypothetical protein IJT96_08475 [Lachnospiraceae bacterium]|nr:hypothetical protein [Lachnospiraceae bacterium]